MTITITRTRAILAGAILVVLVVAGIVLANLDGPSADTPPRSGDKAACVAAMKDSTTGPIEWSYDKNSRPEPCRGLSEADFADASNEFLAEMTAEMGEILGN